MTSTTPQTQDWAVACPDSLAAKTAISVLQSGGNAVDAALAASAMLCVTMPDQTALGGDAFWLIRKPTGEVLAIDAAGPNPGATPSPPVTGAYENTRDPRTVTVPGMVDSWRLAKTEFATRELSELFAPTIELAEEGFEPRAMLLDAISDHLTAGVVDPEFARVYGGCVNKGDDHASSEATNSDSVGVLKQSDLARSLREIAVDPRIFYNGKLAEAIAKRLSQSGSYMSIHDLANYNAKLVDAVQSEFADFKLWQAPPPSQGALVPFGLALREALPTGASEAEDAHLWIESARVMMAVRDTVLGDPTSMKQPVQDYFKHEIINEFAKKISTDAVLSRAQIDKVISERINAPNHMKPLGDTCHLAVVDGAGMSVSLVQSIFWDFGSGIVVPDTGIILQNRGYGQLTDPNAVNCARPGKQPMHTLAAAMMTDFDGGLRGVFGCMGGHAQAQLHLQMLAAIRSGANAQEVIKASRWFADPQNKELHLRTEKGFAFVNELRDIGHEVTEEDFGLDIFGHEQLILIQAGQADAAADSRSNGRAKTARSSM